LPLLVVEDLSVSSSALNAVRGTTLGVLVVVGTMALVLVPFFMMMGPERLLVAGSLEFNPLWVGFAMVASLIGASLAGWVAHRAAGSLSAVILLAVVIMAFGLGDALLHHWLMPQLSLAREGLTLGQMLLGLREPLWYDLSGPVLMALFIWVAGSSRHIETGHERKAS
jgi:hypothetical protein